jgi:4-hydroxybenzoate polyprenyltransferase
MKIKYEGIEKGYPRLPLHRRLRGYIQLLRPFTLLPPLIAGIFLTLAPIKIIDFETLKIGIYVGITLALIQSVGQIINQCVDVELDKLIKKYRPIPSGVIDKDEAMGFAWILSIIAIGRSFTISVLFGIFALILLFFAVFYSLKPFSPRKHAFASLTWQSFSRGFIPPIMCMSIFGSIYDALIYSIIAFIWAFGWQGSKDITDIEGDKKFGISTVANTYGIKVLKMLSIISTIIFTILVIYLNKLLFLIVSVLGICGIINYEKKSKYTENTISWAVFYSGLGLIFLITYFY